MTPIDRCLVAAVCMVLAARVAVAGDPGKSTAERCEHEVTGRVSHLDRNAGTVSIDMPGTSDIELRLSPDEIAGFREGDQVVVSMGLRSRSDEGRRRDVDDDHGADAGTDVLDAPESP